MIRRARVDTYRGRLSSFGFGTHGNQRRSDEDLGMWTKWWWLRIDQLMNWSIDEKHAFLAFVATFVTAALIVSYPVFLFLNNFLDLPREASRLICLILVWPIVLPSLRGLTSSVFPHIVIKGDDAAAARLGGRVFLPLNEFWIRGFWWIDLSLASGKFSDEQTKVRARIFCIAFVVFVPVFSLLALQLIGSGISERAAALIAFVVAAPLATYAGRRMCISRWPDLAQKADDDAVERMKNSIPPRQ
jgi:hypothetical protein